jgi:GAF domain-containing protein
MAGTAQKITGGDWSLSFSYTRQDEIGLLAGAFRGMTNQLKDIISSLEERITERTHLLERRARYLEAATEIGHAASQVPDMDILLTQATHHISQRFGFYHVGIFLLDQAGEYAVLRASNSEGGWKMLTRGHRLKVGSQGIVGYVTGTAQPRIALNVGEDAVHFDNPDLPETRSEMALPLKVGKTLLGALDVQSQEIDAFSQEDASVLTVLANQVAMAIHNAHLLEKVEASLEAERRAYGQLNIASWSETLKYRSGIAFRSDTEGIHEAETTFSGLSQQATQTGLTIVGNQTDNHYPLAVPVISRNVVVGVLDTFKIVEKGPWTPNEIQLIENVAEQLGIALENARLFEETQRKARHERTVANVTSQVWASTDIETILKTAVAELSRALNASEGVIQLNLSDNGEHV